MTLPKRNWIDKPFMLGGRISSLRQAKYNGRTRKYRQTLSKMYNRQLLDGRFRVFSTYSDFLSNNRCIRKFSGDLPIQLSYNLDQIQWINYTIDNC